MQASGAIEMFLGDAFISVSENTASKIRRCREAPNNWELLKRDHVQGDSA